MSDDESPRLGPDEGRAASTDGETVPPLGGRPRLVDRYEVGRQIGKGGIGAVYEARNVASLGERRAIKFLEPGGESAAFMPELVARFEREARTLEGLRHPNIVRMYEFGRTPEGRPFLVLELLEGRDLERAIEAGDLDVEAILDIAIDVCGALAHAHALGIVHRDIKPRNLFLVRSGNAERVRVLDFGIAALLSPDAARADDVAPTRGFVGTPGFASPEQTRGGPVDVRSDLYSLGAVLYVALSGGSRPFDPAADRDTPPIPLRARVAPGAVPAELEALVMRLLAPDRADRPQTADEVAATLRGLRSRSAGLAERAHPRVAGPAVVVGLGALALLAVGLARAPSESEPSPARVDAGGLEVGVARPSAAPPPTAPADAGARAPIEARPARTRCIAHLREARDLASPTGTVDDAFLAAVRAPLERCACLAALEVGAELELRVTLRSADPPVLRVAAPQPPRAERVSRCAQRALGAVAPSKLPERGYLSLTFRR